jgi:hypothetical protein
MARMLYQCHLDLVAGLTETIAPAEELQAKILQTNTTKRLGATA